MRCKLVVSVILCLILAPSLALAQTSTPTPVPTSTPTPTPDVNLFWTLAPSVNQAGTPIPAQDVLFSYSADSGDIAIAVMFGAVIVSVWIMFLISVYLKLREAG